MKKPDAVTVISEQNFRSKVWSLPASDMLGVGRATKKLLDTANICTIGDIARVGPDFLRTYLGINGEKLWRYANGLECSSVRLFGDEPPAKSIGHGITCTSDLYNDEEVKCVFMELAQGVSHRLRDCDMSAGGVQISVKDNALNVRGMQTSVCPTQSFYELTECALGLFKKLYDWKRPVRALSVAAIRLRSAYEPVQQDLFTDLVKRDKREKLEVAMEKIQQKYGRRTIRPAVLMQNIKMPEQNFEETLVMPGYPGC